MLIKHPTIYLDAAGRTTDALLIRDGHVKAVGDQAVSLSEDDEQVVEPEAACLFPALADAHCHLWGVGLRAGSVDLSGTSSTAEIYERLRAHDMSKAPTEWALGYGWDEHSWPDGERLERGHGDDGKLDEIFGDTPACFHRVDRHAVVVNSAALRRAGVGEDYEPTEGGRVVRDDSGRLTGVLVDHAMRPVLDAIPEPSEDEDRQVFLRTAREFLGHGITCAHMALTGVERLSMLREMAGPNKSGQRELPLRVYTIVDGSDARLSEVLDVGPIHDPEGWLSIRALKFFADGALGSQGAHLLEPYEDGSHGLVMSEPTELGRNIASLMDGDGLDDGWQVAVHAIGDAAARNVIEAFAAVPERVRDRLRPRLEHAQMLTDRDCERMGELSAVASIQPIHLRSDGAWADQVLSEQQLERLYPWPQLVHNTTLAAGSDYPIEDCNPWHGIATAMTRKTTSGEVFYGEKTLTREQILEAYTAGAAFAAHWENVMGQLDEGFVGDVIALDRDPFEVTAEEMWEMGVLRVWVAGEEVSSETSSAP
jgi:predicted amidohydrolase YtcJ